MTLHIEMVSDVVCPWCWLGLRRLNHAVTLVPEIDVKILFRSYELDPTIPAAGVDQKSYIAQRFSSDDARQRSTQMRDALIAYGAEEGIPFNFKAIKRRPNSFNAHRLVYWAQGQDLGLQAKEALFTAYFANGQDISDYEVLVTIAGQIGLDVSIISDLLMTDADISKVREEQAMFRQMGITGVPTYIAHRQIAVQGAEDSAKLAKFLRTAAAQMPAERPLSKAPGR
ncbi:MAG: DsbA family oxidoreductase [Henriciella sp.]